MITRVLFVALLVGLCSGAIYLSYMGVGGESVSIERSVRVGSGGGIYGTGSVK